MDLQQTIDELEKQASQYAEAAETLRALLPSSGQAAAAAPAETPRRGRPSQAAVAEESSEGEGTKGNGRKVKKKRTMSPETRAKLSAAATARHAQRKASAES
jgi:hypothetical protein